MPTIHAQDLHLLATSRLEAARDGLLQATIALRNVPPDMYVPSVRALAKSLAAELDVLSTELRGRPERRAKLLNI
jgi:hypothetical protein